MESFREAFYFYRKTYYCVIFGFLFLLGVIVYLIIERNKQLQTIYKLRLQIIELEFKPEPDTQPKRTRGNRIGQDYLKWELRNCK